MRTQDRNVGKHGSKHKDICSIPWGHMSKRMRTYVQKYEDIQLKAQGHMFYNIRTRVRKREDRCLATCVLTLVTMRTIFQNLVSDDIIS